MKRGWLIYDRHNIELPKATSGVAWMVEEAEKAGLEVAVYDHLQFTLIADSTGLGLLYEGKPLPHPDFVLIRVYDLPLARHLEMMGIRVINSCKSTGIAHDKWLSHQVLTGNGIPMPPTIYGGGLSFEELSLKLGTPFVSKHLFGNKGVGVHLVENRKQLESVTQAYPEASLLHQSYIQASYGKDIRVFMVSGEAVFAVMRQSAEGFKSNFALGGSATLYPMDDLLLGLAKKCVEATGLEIAGVDILMDSDRYIVCEVNANPAFRTIGTCSDTNVPSRIFQYIAKL